VFKNLIKKTFTGLGLELSRINSLERQIRNGQFRWIQEIGINTIIDVGANIGQFTLMINQILPDASIYAFEPLRECFQQLKNSTKKINSIKYFNVALGSEEKETTIYKNKFSASSSLLKMEKLHKEIFPFTNAEEVEKIKVVTLGSLRNEISWKSKILLKVDVQGFEIEVLKGIGTVMKMIDIIIIETSFVKLYQGQPLFNEVYSYLIGNGFRFIGNFEQLKDPKTGRILQADSIFIRD
jgi:FkbM family methyltransferase